jgi:hypothetical protein
MSHEELMAPIGMGEDAVVLRDVVEPMPRGARHQARVRAGTRVRVRKVVHDGLEQRYLVETCDERARPTGWWALVPEQELGAAPELPLRAWLRSRLT